MPVGFFADLLGHGLDVPFDDDSGQLHTRPDLELSEDLSQMEVDRVRRRNKRADASPLVRP